MKTKHPFLMWCSTSAAIAILFVVRADAQTIDNSEVETAIRQAAVEYTAAFDRGDAKALASHFTSDAVYVDESGERFEGRDAIEKEYQRLFDNASDLKLKLEIDSIRAVNATTVLEEGRVALSPQPPGANRVMSAYTAVHTLQNGKWLMTHVHDTRVDLSPEPGKLEDLDLLVGTWTASKQGVQVEVKGRWVENEHFLARSHSVTESGKVISAGLQIVGVDPMTGRLTSWSFDSDGGHSVGLWVPRDSGWAVESIGAISDGTETYAVDTLTRVDDQTLLWKSTERWAGDSALSDTEEVRLEKQ